MLSWSLFFKPLDHPQKTLIAVFVVWKSLLLLIAACSPGSGYDTSTTLAQPYDGAAEQNFVVSLLRLFSTKLTRWDAIYFTRIASRDYLYEQDWAFGWGFTRLIKFFASGTTSLSNHVSPANLFRTERDKLSRI
jgi:GPI mannosyltransferase 2